MSTSDMTVNTRAVIVTSDDGHDNAIASANIPPAGGHKLLSIPHDMLRDSGILPTKGHVIDVEVRIVVRVSAMVAGVVTP